MKRDPVTVAIWVLVVATILVDMVRLHQILQHFFHFDIVEKFLSLSR